MKLVVSAVKEKLAADKQMKIKADQLQMLKNYKV